MGIELLGGELVEPPAEPKPKRKYKRRKKHRKREFLKPGHISADPPVLVRGEGWLDGFNSVSCPIACNAERCVISGENVCSHPYKGGLQGKFMQDKNTLARFNEARMVLAHLDTDKKGK